MLIVSEFNRGSRMRYILSFLAVYGFCIASTSAASGITLTYSNPSQYEHLMLSSDQWASYIRGSGVGMSRVRDDRLRAEDYVFSTEAVCERFQVVMSTNYLFGYAPPPYEIAVDHTARNMVNEWTRKLITGRKLFCDDGVAKIIRPVVVKDRIVSHLEDLLNLENATWSSHIEFFPEQYEFWTSPSDPKCFTKILYPFFYAYRWISTLSQQSPDSLEWNQPASGHRIASSYFSADSREPWVHSETNQYYEQSSWYTSMWFRTTATKEVQSRWVPNPENPQELVYSDSKNSTYATETSWTAKYPTNRLNEVFSSRVQIPMTNIFENADNICALCIFDFSYNLGLSIVTNVTESDVYKYQLSTNFYFTVALGVDGDYVKTGLGLYDLSRYVLELDVWKLTETLVPAISTRVGMNLPLPTMDGVLNCFDYPEPITGAYRRVSTLQNNAEATLQMFPRGCFAFHKVKWKTSVNLNPAEQSEYENNIHSLPLGAYTRFDPENNLVGQGTVQNSQLWIPTSNVTITNGVSFVDYLSLNPATKYQWLNPWTNGVFLCRERNLQTNALASSFVSGHNLGSDIVGVDIVSDKMDSNGVIYANSNGDYIMWTDGGNMIVGSSQYPTNTILIPSASAHSKSNVVQIIYSRRMRRREQMPDATPFIVLFNGVRQRSVSTIDFSHVTSNLVSFSASTSHHQAGSRLFNLGAGGIGAQFPYVGAIYELWMFSETDYLINNNIFYDETAQSDNWAFYYNKKYGRQ